MISTKYKLITVTFSCYVSVQNVRYNFVCLSIKVVRHNLKISLQRHACNSNTNKIHTKICRVGRDTVVGIATRHGLDGPGIESLWGRDFPHPVQNRPGAHQPPLQRESNLFPSGKAAGTWR
jgi:hypothetical protein